MEFGEAESRKHFLTRGQTSLEFMKLTSDPANAYLQQIPNTARGRRRRSDQGRQRGDWGVWVLRRTGW